MKRSLVFLVALVVSMMGVTPALRAGRPHASPAAIGAEPVATGLDNPAAFTFGPDGRIWYGERFTGEIRIYNPANGSNTLFFTIPDVEIDGEQGLLGLALHPDYPAPPFVFAYATRSIGGVDHNQILRIRDTGGSGSNMKPIWTDDVAALTFHNGGRILFGADGALYAVVGDHGNPALSQGLGSDVGKVLRMTSRGDPADGNPFGTLVWAYGLRNSYGFTFDPLTGRMWETEAGPECNDEINLERAGDNHAWGPNQTCSEPPAPPINTNQDGPNPVLPVAFFGTVITPIGTAFCAGCGLSGSQGALFFNVYNLHQIRRALLTPNRRDIASIATVYTHPTSVLSMETGPGGTLYFSEPGGIYRLIES